MEPAGEMQELLGVRKGMRLPGGWTVRSLGFAADGQPVFTIVSDEREPVVLRLGGRNAGPFPVGLQSLFYESTPVAFERFSQAAARVASVLDQALGNERSTTYR